MEKILSILFLMILSHSIVAQTAAGGGAYLQNNGKLINCIVTGNYAANGFGVSGTSGSSVLNCNITGNLYLSTQIVTPGDMVMSDGSVYTPQYDTKGNLIFSDGHTAADVVGVCFWTNGNNDYINAKSWVIAVTENTSLQWTPAVNNQQVDITTPYASGDLIDFSDPSAALIDKDGFGNTAKIVSDSRFTGTSLQTTANCAAKYCNLYNSQVGVWFLPSLGQLQELYNSVNTVNTVLGKLNRTAISTSPYWSSTELDSEEAWRFDFSAGNGLRGDKGSAPSRVRAMKIISKSN